MKVLVTGSSGHLGEGLVRTLRDRGDEVVGVDIKPGEFTEIAGSITDVTLVKEMVQGVDAILHTATLHKPHVVTHSMQDFVDTNVTGTLVLLEAAVEHAVKAFVFTSTTSVFGHALRPPKNEPAAWVTEELSPVPKNIYGITKLAAEEICRLVHRKQGLPCLVLRTSRFFPEEDDSANARSLFTNDNLKVNEYLNRRVDLQDAVNAHLLAIDRAPEIGFERFIISASTPFQNQDVRALRQSAPQVVADRVVNQEVAYEGLNWKLPADLDRVYVNHKAVELLGWQPEYNFYEVLQLVKSGQEYRSPLALAVGSKGYHAQVFKDGPFPVDDL